MKRIKILIYIFIIFILIGKNLNGQETNNIKKFEPEIYIKKEILLGKKIKYGGDFVDIKGLMIGDDGYLYLQAGIKEDDKIYNFVDNTFKNAKERGKYASANIIKLNSKGEKIFSIKKNIMSMAVDENGDIYIVPDDNKIKGESNKIIQYDKNGKEIKQFKTKYILKCGKISRRLLITSKGEFLNKYDKKQLLIIKKNTNSDINIRKEKIFNGDIKLRLIYEGLDELNKDRLKLDDIEWEKRFNELPIFIEISGLKSLGNKNDFIKIKVDIKGKIPFYYILNIDKENNIYILLEKSGDEDKRYTPFIYIYKININGEIIAKLEQAQYGKTYQFANVEERYDVDMNGNVYGIDPREEGFYLIKWEKNK